jgi:hypothetical protein
VIEYLFGNLLKNPGALFEACGNYNEAVWPMQVIGYVLGIIAIFWGIKRIKYSDNIITLILSYFWLWAGFVFCVIFFAPDYKVFYILGSLAIIQGILFLLFGLRSHKLLPLFTFRFDLYGIIGAIYILYALIFYPFIGYWTGYPYPDYPIFGVAPCPVCIFTFGLFMWARKRLPMSVLVIPLIESVAGIVPFVLGLYADIGLVVGGIGGFLLILHKNRRVQE